MATAPEPGRLPDLSSDHPLRPEETAAFLRDGHVRVRGLAAPREVEAYRPAIRGVLDALAARHETQGRIDDYNDLFTQAIVPDGHGRRRAEAHGVEILDANVASRLSSSIEALGSRTESGPFCGFVPVLRSSR